MVWGAAVLDVGWSEIFLIVVIAILVIGPEDMPKVMHMIGRIVRRLQYVRYAFSKQFEDFMEASDLDDLQKQVNFEAKDIEEIEEIAEEEGKSRAENAP